MKSKWSIITSLLILPLVPLAVLMIFKWRMNPTEIAINASWYYKVGQISLCLAPCCWVVCAGGTWLDAELIGHWLKKFLKKMSVGLLLMGFSWGGVAAYSFIQSHDLKKYSFAPLDQVVKKPDETDEKPGEVATKIGFDSELKDAGRYKTEEEKARAKRYFHEGQNAFFELNFEEAVSQFQQSINVMATMSAHLNQGLCYVNLDHLDEAINTFSSGLGLAESWKHKKFRISFHLSRGNAYFAKVLRDLYRREGKRVYLFGSRKEIDEIHKKARNREEYKLAEADLNKGVELDTKYGISYNDRGTLYLDTGQLDKAISDFEQAIRFAPEYAIHYRNPGSAYRHKEDFKNAVLYFDKAIELNPRYFNAYIEKGAASLSARQDKDAINAFIKATQIRPESGYAYYCLGHAWRASGDHNKARKAYKVACDKGFKEACKPQYPIEIFPGVLLLIR